MLYVHKLSCYYELIYQNSVEENFVMAAAIPMYIK